MDPISEPPHAVLRFCGETCLRVLYIEFRRVVERWPAGLDRIFRGKFTTKEGRSSFRGYFLLGKEGFRWQIYGCCG